ncbi:(2Fe-2S) ferredoxin domain-containing protein [Sphingobium sp. WCS2017Hpa-17]|uniref:(2Fe-2S) ferredoxin domain-containing protein n=1 Tax=Sphingobium sp. WCS2017Hpa-17 TaxID=3073638 RepID=UPI00288B4C5C|nr:(2Fe-2S) ferredoxin domain-containing protein [Sphingobium sp. WCS2017Hpa-17]
MEAAGGGGLKDLVRSNWSNVVLVCRKCSKKLDGGFGPGGDERLAKALRKHLSLKKGRKAAAGIVEVNCLGVCPRGAVTVVDGAASRDWLLVRPGADLDELTEALGLGNATHP